MTPVELQALFDRIISGHATVIYNTKIYCIKDINALQRPILDNYYQEMYATFVNDGLLSDELKDSLLKQKSIWLEKDEVLLTERRDRIKELRREVLKHEFQSIKKQLVVTEINKIEREIKKIVYRKNSLLMNTADYFATIEKYKYSLFLNTYDTTGTKIWGSFEEFQNESEGLISHLLDRAYYNDEINEDKIRLLARSEPWRSIWVAANKVGNLFSTPLVFCTEMQKVLISWSLIYDTVYESMESPSDEIINNDILLDAWLQKQSEKRKKEKKSGEVDALILGDKVKNSDEIGIVVDSVEDAQKVYALNSSDSHRIIQQREKKINELKEVKEGQLPDIQRDLRMRKNQLESKHIKG